VIALLWGLPGDATLTAVHRAVRRIGIRTVFLDQRTVLDTAVELSVGKTVEGGLSTADRTVDLTEIGAAYLRPHDAIRAGGVSSPEEKQHAHDVSDALTAWADVTPAYVVNRPSASASNGSKPAQLKAIAAAGFCVPETVVTNDPDLAGDFKRQHRAVIYKSVSSVRSRVRGLADDVPLDAVRHCPTQFQARVPGTDVRVHVVGAEVFPTRIDCTADDYRYAVREGLPRPGLDAIDLPDHVAQRCSGLATRLGLPVAGIDLRVTPDDEWYCFEVNPSPAFTYYEYGTGQPIAAAVAGLLAAAVTMAEVSG
jgi:hypothetical protein